MKYQGKNRIMLPDPCYRVMTMYIIFVVLALS